MGKTANCIKMIKILSDGAIHGISELAQKLETNPRNIIVYRDEIESAGYPVIGAPGRYGGYRIVKQEMFPCPKLTRDEKNALSAGAGYLKARNDFPQRESYESAMEKIFCSENGGVEPFNPTVIPRFPLAMNEIEIRKRYDIMQDAIKKQFKIKSIIDQMIILFAKGQYIRINCICITMDGLFWHFARWRKISATLN